MSLKKPLKSDPKRGPAIKITKAKDSPSYNFKPKFQYL